MPSNEDRMSVHPVQDDPEQAARLAAIKAEVEDLKAEALNARKTAVFGAPFITQRDASTLDNRAGLDKVIDLPALLKEGAGKSVRDIMADINAAQQMSLQYMEVGGAYNQHGPFLAWHSDDTDHVPSVGDDVSSGGMTFRVHHRDYKYDQEGRLVTIVLLVRRQYYNMVERSMRENKTREGTNSGDTKA